MITQGHGGLRYGRSSARRPRLSTTPVDATLAERSSVAYEALCLVWSEDRTGGSLLTIS